MTRGVRYTWIEVHGKPLSFYILRPHWLNCHTSLFNTLSLDYYSQKHGVNWIETGYSVELGWRAERTVPIRKGLDCSMQALSNWLSILTLFIHFRLLASRVIWNVSSYGFSFNFYRMLTLRQQATHLLSLSGFGTSRFCEYQNYMAKLHWA